MNEKAKLFPFAGSLDTACERMLASSTFASVFLLLVISWQIGILCVEASRKRFWYDELLTLHVSTLRPFSHLWSALQAGVDGMPPGYYAIVQLTRMLPGDPQLLLRLPSILGYVLTLAGVYLFARWKLPVLAGLTAVLLLSLSPFRPFALEARSYSLVVGFLAIAAALWQRVDEKRFMTPLLAVFLTLAVSCYHLAIVTLSAFGLAELTLIFQSRRIRWGVWAAILIASSPFLLALPILLHFKQLFGKNFWSQPSWNTAIETYGGYVGLDSSLVLVLLMFFGIVIAVSLLAMLRNPQEGASRRDFSPPELVLIGGLMFYPALLAILTKILHSGYTTRYGWPAILGLVLGLVYLFRAGWPRSAHLFAAFLLAFTIQSVFEVRLLAKGDQNATDGLWANIRTEPEIPAVIGSGILFLQLLQDAPPDLKARLVQVADTEMAIRLVGTDSVDKVNHLLAQFIQLRVEDLKPFEAAHNRFFLYSSAGFDWFTLYLLEKQYNLRLLSKDEGGSLYIVQR